MSTTSFLFKQARASWRRGRARTVVTGLGVSLSVAAAVAAADLAGLAQPAADSPGSGCTLVLTASPRSGIDPRTALASGNMAERLDQASAHVGAAGFTTEAQGHVAEIEVRGQRHAGVVSFAEIDSSDPQAALAVYRPDPDFPALVRVGERIGVNGRSFSVMALAEPSYDEQAAEVILSPAAAALVNPTPAALTATVTASGGITAEDCATLVTHLNSDMDAGLRFVNLSALDAATGQEIAAGVSGALVSVSAVALLLSAFNIANLMLISVLDRQDEIGLLRSLGMSRRRLAASIIVESVMVVGAFTVLGAALGILTGALLGDVLGRQVLTSWMALGGVVSITLVVAVLSAGFPAYRATRLDPSAIAS